MLGKVKKGGKDGENILGYRPFSVNSIESTIESPPNEIIRVSLVLLGLLTNAKKKGVGKKGERERENKGTTVPRLNKKTHTKTSQPNCQEPLGHTRIADHTKRSTRLRGTNNEIRKNRPPFHLLNT